MDAIMAAVEQLRQVNLHQQHEMRAMREEMSKMKCAQSEECDIGLGPSGPEQGGFEEHNGPSPFRGHVSPAD